jgi:hypothetical protein
LDPACYSEIEKEGLPHAPIASGSPFHFDTKELTKMSTPAQIAANQSNAQASTGPTSATGKQIVAGNAVKHHLTGKGNPALAGEDEAFTKHVAGYMQSYAPVGIPEEDLVRNLAENNWRLTRAHAMERALLNQLAADETVDPADAEKALHRTSLYAHRIQRAIEKNRAELKSMQDQRKSAYAKTEQEAILLTQLAHAKGQPPDQSKEFPFPELYGGFVYSLPEIARLVARAARLEEARMRFMPAA